MKSNSPSRGVSSCRTLGTMNRTTMLPQGDLKIRGQGQAGQRPKGRSPMSERPRAGHQLEVWGTVSSPSGVRGRASAAKRFLAFYRHQMAFPGISKAPCSRWRHRVNAHMSHYIISLHFFPNILVGGGLEPITPHTLTPIVTHHHSQIFHFLSVKTEKIKTYCDIVSISFLISLN